MPRPPGFVSEMFVPWKSSGVSLFSRVLLIRSSYAPWKPAKSRASAPLMQGTIRLRDPSFFCTSTAMPRLTGESVITNGLPSRSSKVRTITGHSVAARTMAHAIRCVNESLIPRSLSWVLIALRLASSVSTGSVRNDVAVGVVRLSSMALTSIAAGPRRGLASPAFAGAAGAAPLPSAASTSAFTTLPPGPEPSTDPRSTPRSAAIRRATGEARPSPSTAAAPASAGTASA